MLRAKLCLLYLPPGTVCHYIWIWCYSWGHSVTNVMWTWWCYHCYENACVSWCMCMHILAWMRSNRRSLYGITRKMCMNTKKRQELVHWISDAARWMNNVNAICQRCECSMWSDIPWPDELACAANTVICRTLGWTVHERNLNLQPSLIKPVQIILNLKCL